MFKYSPPAQIDDFAGRPARQNFLDDWHGFLYGHFAKEIAVLKSGNDGDDVAISNPLFFSEVDTSVNAADTPIPWSAFPLSIARRHPNDDPGAWTDAELLADHPLYDPNQHKNVVLTLKHRKQDEYCEWHTYRKNAVVSRIVFTAEGPEYWIHLAKFDRGLLLKLYQEFVSPDVVEQDLYFDRPVWDSQLGPFAKDSYNPWNVWNTEKGVLHLTHPANTLGAEINLAAQATIQRVDANNQQISDVRRLICCSGYGSANRSSDPTIGQAVNLAVRGGVSATLADPVGLYMRQLPTLTDATGQPINWFKTRGTPGRVLRAELTPPEGSTSGFDQVLVEGVKFASAGQIAQQIQMALYAKTTNLGLPAGPLGKCISHCCMPKGANPKNSNFAQAEGVDQTCAELAAIIGAKDLVDVYPELTTPTEVTLAARATRRAHG
jgi:hypothetical protein